MNPELAPETTGKAENFSIRFLKWAVGTILSLEILGVIFWLLFYSVYFANFSFVIPLRNWYQGVHIKLVGKPIYIIQVIKSEIGYTYSLRGRFVGFEPEQNLLYVRGDDDKNYTLVVHVDSGNPSFVAGQLVTINWSDKRTLYKMLSDFSNNISLLNPSSPLIFPE